MLKFEMTHEIFLSAKEEGLILSDCTYSDEYQAEQDGYYWYDDITSWVQVDKLNQTYGKELNYYENK